MAPKTGPKSSLIAVDTNVLMDMAEGNSDTLKAIASCVRLKGYQVIATPRVVKELAFGAECWEDPRCVYARKALARMLEWGIKPETVVPLNNGICELFASDMCATLLPRDEWNDAIVLLEAAILGAVLLVTWDFHLSGIDKPKLAKFLKEHHVYATVICTPAQVNRFAK